MAKNDPDQLDKVAADVKSEPYAFTDLARQYVEKDTDILLIAFGVLGIPMVQFSYKPAREQQLENLRSAVTRIEEMANGLARVAANWRGADHASTPVGRQGLTTYTPPAGSGYARDIGEAGVIAAGFVAAKLLPKWIACNTIAGYIGKLERVAFAMTTIWGLCTPIDEPIDRAIGAWNAAKTQLDAVSTKLDDVLKPLDEAWEEGTDRDAFDRWKDRFMPEFADASQAAGKTAEALHSAKNTVVGYQTAYFTFCLSVLVTMIALIVASAVPQLKPFAEAMKKVLALVAVAGTAGLVAGIANALNASMTVLPGIMAAGSEFGKLAINVGGGGVGFKDVGTNWDDRLENIKMV